jgi:hypothetical protein
MEIKPTYVTFEQAKGLKEKRFNEICLNAYNLNGLEYNNGWCEYIDDNELEINNSNLRPRDVAAPEQWQVVEWLRVNHGIWISVDMVYETTQTGFWYSIRQSKEDDKAICSNEYPTPQEAYSAAFDYVLKNLL